MIDESKNRHELYVLGKSKEVVINKLNQSDDLVSLVLGEGIPIEDIINTNIFDTLVIDLTQNEAKTYITMESIVSSIENNKIKSIELTIDVFTHLSCRTLTDDEKIKYTALGLYGNRIDCVVDLVARTIKDDESIGVSQLKFRERNPMTIIQPNSNYYGKRLYFTVYDL